MKPMEQWSFEISPVPPYNFELTASYITRFSPENSADKFDGSVYSRLLELGNRLFLIRVSSSGSVDKPLLSITVFCDSSIDQETQLSLKQISVRLLGANHNPKPFYELIANDGILKKTVEPLYGLHIPQTASIYEALIQAIVGQQVSSHVAKIIRLELVRRFGRSFESANENFFSFPCAVHLAKAGLDELKAIKLSTRKAEYIKDISEGVVSGEIALESLAGETDDGIREYLTRLRGVGDWTVEWLLVLAFGREDGFPYQDLALCRTLGKLLEIEKPLAPQEALRYSRQWSPYRSWVTAYIFAAIRSGALWSQARGV
ncbi:MAG: DNA-3-methyladenine glycosylase 2 family protein [Chloroflexi bacterium]|nr:DNA-3-methyladenine glycosylase 2 family protein [Chloroflexota bacterium]